MRCTESAGGREGKCRRHRTRRTARAPSRADMTTSRCRSCTGRGGAGASSACPSSGRCRRAVNHPPPRTSQRAGRVRLRARLEQRARSRAAAGRGTTAFARTRRTTHPGRALREPRAPAVWAWKCRQPDHAGVGRAGTSELVTRTVYDRVWRQIQAHCLVFKFTKLRGRIGTGFVADHNLG